MVEDDKFTCSSTKDKLLCFSFKIVIIMARLSPLVTLIIGYVLGYVLYPASQLWTCSCLYDDNADVNTAHAQPNFVARRAITVQSSKKDIASPDTAQDESTVVEGEYGRKTAVYASWRRFLSSRPGSPAYMSLEYKVRGRIFIGVITAEKYLATRAKAIHETWARAMGLSSKVVFYVGADCNTSHPGLEAMNIVRLKNVRDTVYPPQRKVFEALKHMYRHYGNNYQWFVRADDDAYIRVTRLDRLLGRLDPNEKVYLGRAGVGRKEDVGRLQLKASERYCMGGPGVVLSRATLRETTPHLDRCLEEVEVHNRIGRRGVAEGAWFNEDVELGRCISRMVGIQCSHSKEVNV